MPVDIDTVQSWRGREVVDVQGQKVGTVDEIYLDDETDQPEEHEVVLHEEEVVVGKQAVPKERVRLDKETVVEQRRVDEQVRKEQIEVDPDADPGSAA